MDVIFQSMSSICATDLNTWSELVSMVGKNEFSEVTVFATSVY